MIFKYKKHPRTKGSETIVTIVYALMLLGIGVLWVYTAQQISENDKGDILAWLITALVYLVINYILQWVKTADTMYSTLAFTYNQSKGLYIYDVNADRFLANCNLRDYKIHPAKGGYFTISTAKSKQQRKQNILLKELDKRQIFDNIINNGLEDDYGKRIYSIRNISKKSNCIKLTYSYLDRDKNNSETEATVKIYKGINDYNELYELVVKLKKQS